MNIYLAVLLSASISLTIQAAIISRVDKFTYSVVGSITFVTSLCFMLGCWMTILPVLPFLIAIDAVLDGIKASKEGRLSI